MSIPQSQLLTALRRDMVACESFFSTLENNSLCSLANTCREFQNFIGNAYMTNNRPNYRKAAELLFCVLNPTATNLSRMEQLLSGPQPKGLSIILIQVRGKEAYFNSKQNEILPRLNRVWHHPMSALEAAFRCGDPHLVLRLAGKVPADQKAHALEQLQNVSAQCVPDRPGNYLYDLACLRTAYKTYLQLRRDLLKNNNHAELDRLYGCLGDAQKNLFWFLLQVFCNPVPHAPMPDFTKEPTRDCLLFRGARLDLDSIGTSSFSALIKADGAT